MRAKNLEWEAIKVDLFKAEQYDTKYLKLNPKGIVPTLVHDESLSSNQLGSASILTIRFQTHGSFPPIHGSEVACGYGARWLTKGCLRV